MINFDNEFPHVIFWADDEPTGAVGWLVIDSLAQGVATGGLFMHPDAKLIEVLELAASMTRKNSLQTPAIGGAKAGIKFDHTHSEASNVLRRFLIAHKHYLETIWSTGADLNTDNNIINRIIFDDLNLSSGQYSLGKMLGNFYGIENQAGSFIDSIRQPINGFTLGEYATGFSIAACIKTLCLAFPDILIQGWGTVGRSLSYILHNEKLAKVVGIIEQNYFLYDNQRKGLDINELLSIRESCICNNKFELDAFLNQAQRAGYSVIRRVEQETNEDFLAACLHMPADVFCPCATRFAITERISQILSRNTFKNKENKNCWLISGANNVFENKYSRQILCDDNISMLPEWFSNSGNTLLYNEILKQPDAQERTPDKLLQIIRERIQRFLSHAVTENSKTKTTLYEACYKLTERVGKKDLFVYDL